MESLEFSGQWWIPAEPQRTVAGTLRFSPMQGFTMELVGAFKDVTELQQTATYPLIIGVAPTRLVTLYDCMEAGTQLTFPGLITQRISPSYGFIGAHFADPSELNFHVMEAQFSYLADWTGISALQVSMQQRVPRGEKLYEVSYALPPELKVEVPGASIGLSHSFRSEGDVLREITVRQSVSLRVEVANELFFEDWLARYVFPLRNFLSLATDRPNHITDILFYSKEKTMITSKGEVRPIPIRVVFRQPFFEPIEKRRLSPFDMMFALDDVKDNFELILTRWLELSEALAEPLDLFFAVQYDRRMHLGHQFLNVVQAAEAYHRQCIRNEVLPKDDHEKRVKAILSSVPAEHTIWLEDVLNYTNEPRLRQRLKDLIDRAGPAGVRLVGDVGRFIQRVLDTRNFLTHRDPDLADRAAHGADLYWLTKKLSFILQASYLAELGLAVNQIAELFERNQHYALATNS